MKLFFAGLTLCLLMAGCATPPPAAAPEPAQPVTDAHSPMVKVPPAPLKSIIPSGPLDPITSAQATSRGVAFMQPPTDLWDRIRRGFKMQPLENDLVRQQEQWYATRPDYIQRMTERSRKYLFHIVEDEISHRGQIRWLRARLP